MPDDKAVGAAREAAVGEQGHVTTKARAHDGTGGGQHLRHAGSALGTHIADDDNAAFRDFAPLQGGQHRLLVVKNERWARKELALLACDLRHSTTRRKVTLENADVARVLYGALKRRENSLVSGKAALARKVFGKRLPGDGHGAAVKKALLQKVFHHCRRAAHVPHVLHDIAPARLQVCNQGDTIADPLEVLDDERHAGCARHSQQVQHSVG
mmetsp:Transcript_36622/g.91818  ORF Transcript_36622/g.91818 Transcript_36622/m.91818 type:complete len:212 (-) Transcript_36622:952-1587(-)